MSYTLNGNTVAFEYDADEVFEACALKTAYLSRRVKDDEGKYTGEELVLTQDEREAFDRCLQESVAGLEKCAWEEAKELTVKTVWFLKCQVVRAESGQ